ncbi:MAG TPA: hypothetical protein VGI91_04020 [Steroidobacteraceae bacterium]|jgi:hypothetical protein
MSDLARIDELVAAFFRAFDNRPGTTPSAFAMAELFVETAVICQHRGDGYELCSPLQFARPRAELLTNGTLSGFHEWEVESTTTVRGPLATRVSRYAKTGSLNGAPYGGGGTKVFQLARLNGHWRILALSWFDHPD